MKPISSFLSRPLLSLTDTYNKQRNLCSQGQHLQSSSPGEEALAILVSVWGYKGNKEHLDLEKEYYNAQDPLPSRTRAKSTACLPIESVIQR